MDKIQPTPGNLGNLKVRRNRFIVEDKGLIGKIGTQYSADENNVVFGLGSNTHGAAATGQVLTAGAARYMIARRLVIAAGNVRGRVKSIKVEGNEMLQGKSVPFEQFSILNLNAPTFNLPIPSGTPVEITYDVDAASTVEASFDID